MSGLTKYIEKVKKYIDKHEDMTEIEKMRYVYLDLGKRFSFDLNIAFGNGETKRKIYANCLTEENIEKSMKTNVILCRSLAYILAEIYQKIGIKAEAVKDENEDYKRPCKHVYNVVTLKDGTRYAMDLQQDLYNIQSHSRTEWFGVDTDIHKEKMVMKVHDLEEIDRKLGYIDDENYYSNDYKYTMKADIGLFDDFFEKVDFFLTNIDIHQNKNMKYVERYLHHEELINEFFSEKERKKIYMIDCYYQNGDKIDDRDYQNCVVASSGKDIKIYMYSVKDYCYKQVSIEEFADKIKNGLTYVQGIPGLRNALKRLETGDEER